MEGNCTRSKEMEECSDDDKICSRIINVIKEKEEIVKHPHEYDIDISL